MRRFCLVMIVVTALVVAGSSNKAFAANVYNDTAGTERSIIAPYWQADANSVYSFISIAVPSISSSISRQVTVAAVTSDSRSDVSQTITVDKGKSAKFFIANTNHSSVNSNTVKNANWIGVTGIGHVVITALDTTGALTQQMPSTGGGLSVWGAVVVPGGTGFAMEFIGDLTDSIGGSNSVQATAPRKVGL